MLTVVISKGGKIIDNFNYFFILIYFSITGMRYVLLPDRAASQGLLLEGNF